MTSSRCLTQHLRGEPCLSLVVRPLTIPAGPFYYSFDPGLGQGDREKIPPGSSMAFSVKIGLRDRNPAESPVRRGCGVHVVDQSTQHSRPT